MFNKVCVGGLVFILVSVTIAALIVTLTITVKETKSKEKTPKHVLFIVADDLGWLFCHL
jgi:hypothetical protein